MEEKKNELNMAHHKRFEYCRNRLKYREGKILTAVKVVLKELSLL